MKKAMIEDIKAPLKYSFPRGFKTLAGECLFKNVSNGFSSKYKDEIVKTIKICFKKIGIHYESEREFYNLVENYIYNSGREDYREFVFQLPCMEKPMTLFVVHSNFKIEHEGPKVTADLVYKITLLI